MPGKPGPPQSLGTPADMRNTMIERAEAVRAKLVARLEQSDLRPQARRTTFGQIRMIEERLVDLRDGE